MKEKFIEGERAMVVVSQVVGGGDGSSDGSLLLDIPPDDVNGNPPLPPTVHDLQLQTSRGGPRVINICRSDQGFGFTLRHFIVYPPELTEVLGENVGAVAAVSSLEPLDTIFVKYVRPGSAAHLAGLATGDRVVSVNGESVGTRSYQEVVSTIQRSPPTLQLMVVPREEDLLQQVFGDTAHNPESNLDVRMPSPSHPPPQQPIRHNPQTVYSPRQTLLPPSQYPPSLSPSAWSSQSSLGSHISTMSTGPHPPSMTHLPVTPTAPHPPPSVIVAHPPFHQRPHQPSVTPQPHGAHIPVHSHQQNVQQPPVRGKQSSAAQRSSSRKHSFTGGGDKKPVAASVNRKQSLPAMTDRRQAVCTIQNSISGVPHHVPTVPGNQSPVPASTNTNESTSASVFGVYEPILDRAVGRGSFRDSRRLERDPDGRIYEVVKTRVVESKVGNTGEVMKHGSRRENTQNKNQVGHVGRKSQSGEGDAKRVRVQSLSPPRLKVDQSQARSASVHTRPEALSVNINKGNVHTCHQSLKSTKHEALPREGTRLNVHRKSCTEPFACTYSRDENCPANDNKTQEVINRIKKNVERKEEFLKRPNQPIWLPVSKAPIVHSDYHVNPQKLQRPVWPPPSQTPPSPGTITKALSFIVTPKQEHQLRRVKSEIEHRRHSSVNPRETSFVSTPLSLSQSSVDNPVTEMHNYSEDISTSGTSGTSSTVPRSLVGNSVPKPYAGNTSEANVNSTKYGKSFVSTLSRIQENIPIPELGSSSSLASQSGPGGKQGSISQGTTPSGTPSGSQTSLNSPSIRSIPLAWVGDNERIKQLQIVSKRAKQFESSQLEKEASAKSAFHRFELSRLSQRSKIPNVAQRKQEFEKKDGDLSSPGLDFEFGTNYSNCARQRKSAELMRVDLASQDMSPMPPKVLRSFSDGGTVFPVSRSLYSPTPEDQMKSLPYASDGGVVMRGMNRTNPVGGPHIHCEPPSGYVPPQHRPQSDSDVLERERSNSVCSQASMTSLWSTQSMDETGSARNKNKSLARQNSYLSAVRSPIPVGTASGGVVASGSTPVVTSAVTPTAATTSAPATTTSTCSTVTNAQNADNVTRRSKGVYEEEGERVQRRVSYLKATSGDRMYSDSDFDSDVDDTPTVAGGGGVEVSVGGGVGVSPSSPAGPHCVGELPSPASLQSAVLRQGTLHVKLTMVDGKRAPDRSWKTVWAVVQGRAIIFYKDRQHAMQTPLGVEEQISLRGAEVEVASDYTKRRNVLRLATPGGSQLLFQADTPPEMLAWLSTLHNNCAIQEGEASSKTPMNNNNVSPQTGNKGMRKFPSSLRTRSPTGQSPSTKTRKPSNIESNSSPKSKTWKGHLVRPFMRKIPGVSPAVTPTTPLPEGATIGVCLEDCPQSRESDFVPLLVSLCVGVVESRGLQTQGIYRIPGNKAAVTHLTEMINKGPKCIDFDDPRWTDVNVISSVLKQFFQKLPEPLFTCELYPHFIEASKIEDPTQRMLELKKLVHDLPDHHYETLRFLILHLNNIVSNCDSNKMDVRNLAIVFGPTLVRSGDDNMVTMVTDMSHQCRIVETLISHAEWFFSDDDGEDLAPPVVVSPGGFQSPDGEATPTTTESETPSSQNLLLHNIQKVEGNSKGDMKKDIVSSIISAANRKVNKVKNKKPVEDKPADESKYSDKEGGFEERDIDKEAELRKSRLLAKQIESMVELPDPKPMSERKISNMSLMSVDGHLAGVCNMSHSSNSERTSGSEQLRPPGLPEEDGRLFCVVKKNSATTSVPSVCASSSSTISSSTNQQSSQSTSEPNSLFGDEVAIRSYAGLSASTQERIRRFEMETRAMLHRDLTRHRRETERRDAERRRLEELWQRAKQDMESEDILDQLADNPTEVARKISDYSWRLQGVRENVGGERGSVASQGSSSSSQAALISAALSHHPLSNTSLTPTTNATTTQVSNNTHAQPPLTQVVSDPAKGMACESANDMRHGMTQSQSLRWLDYNAASPHSTLDSTCSSSSSGYGSLTRSSHVSNQTEEDLVAKPITDSCQSEPCELVIKPPTSSSQHSSPASSKKKNNTGSSFNFGLSSSASSPSLFPSMAESGTELTPTRKIGQTTIYPESPRLPSHNSRLPTPAHPSQSHLSPPASTLTPHPTTPLTGRHKDSVLHHILPSRLYHSPRPLRRGSSAENVTQPLITPLSPPTFDTQKVANNGTLKRAKAGRDQILNGPEIGVPRCGSLDSLRDGPHISHDDGSDLLTAITATFEEKMRSLQESPLGAEGAASDDKSNTTNPSPEAGFPHDCNNRRSSECRLYRDPSLHRRRTNPRNPSTNNSTSSNAVNSSFTTTTTTSQVEDISSSFKLSEDGNKLPGEDSKREVKVKRSDSLTKSEKTENNIKEKTEKRARELKRTDTQESLNEKKPKEMKRSDNQDGSGRSRDLPRKSDSKENSSKRPSDVRSRRHNVKELKEKFEQNTSNQPNSSPMKPSNNNHYNNNVSNINNSKASKSGMRRTGYRGPIKRRHTVGGTKDLAKWAWLHSSEISRSSPRSTRLTAWERLQPVVADERLNTDRSLEAWLVRERIRTSSPDLSRPQQLVLPCDVDDKENLHRRLSVQEPVLNPLYPVLESHV